MIGVHSITVPRTRRCRVSASGGRTEFNKKITFLIEDFLGPEVISLCSAERSHGVRRPVRTTNIFISIPRNLGSEFGSP
jgi:hypothetical protein